MAFRCSGVVGELESRRFSRCCGSPQGIWRGREAGRVLIFALDSNVVIHALKGTGRVAERFAEVNPGDISIPAVVVYELEFGTLRAGVPARRRRELGQLIGAISILPFDDRAASRAAGLRYDLEKSGFAIGPLDALIAGTALAHGAKLVTHNMREFARVPGLQVEDWF